MRSTLAIEFKEIQKLDLKQIVEIHFDELGEGFLTMFGKEFVKQFYSSLLEAGNWGFLAKDKDIVVGFIFATKVEVPFHKCLTFFSITNFLLESVWQPAKLYSFLIAFKQFFIMKGKVKIKSTDTIIELSHFAVQGRHKGIGIGKKLIGMLEDKARETGFCNVFTRTHNKRLADHYVLTKKATILETISLRGSDSIILKWKV